MPNTNSTQQLEPSRDSLRSRRKREVRAKTINYRRGGKRELERERAIYPEAAKRLLPVLRADCMDQPRPCPHVSCKHHLYLDVSARTGTLKLNFPDVDVEALDQLPSTCTLDVAARGGVTLEELGAIMNLTRERIHQIEVKALAKVHASVEGRSLEDWVEG